MIKFKLIPAIDIMDWQCVRLFQWDFDQKKIYNSDPLMIAKLFENSWLQYLHLVDLDWAKEWKVVNWNIIESICKNTSLKVEFGGWIRTTDDIQKLLDLWIKTINVSSVVVKNPNLFLDFIKKFWSDSFSIGLDIKDWFVYIHGWKTKTDFSLDDLLKKWWNFWIRKFNITNIANDGSMWWIDETFYQKIVRKYTEFKIIASWWVKDIQDVIKIEKVGCRGVIVGKAIYEWKIDLISNNY
jgi:phosphoribosylformimino-5-aminoimidazole carboxamide ribotide isomerase